VIQVHSLKQSGEEVMSQPLKAAKRKLKRDIGELLAAVGDCFKNRRILPGLVLLYATIDILASLDRPDSKQDVTRDDFVAWVDAFLLPGSSLKCTGIDLHAARCGLLHTYAPGSRLSGEGKAKEMYYAWGKAKIGPLERSMQNIDWKIPAVAVHVDALHKAVEDGLQTFRRVLGRDSTRATRAYGRAAKFLGNVPTELVSFSASLPRINRRARAASSEFGETFQPPI
jgi:hypothetical protein